MTAGAVLVLVATGAAVVLGWFGFVALAVTNPGVALAAIGAGAALLTGAIKVTRDREARASAGPRVRGR